ncbi:uncharacterized protein [Nicotiana sylvestris]|uniref:uncharacterized protein n=1 Tax=Nicotiana sylvestris TaxID=4096 RepID=UPI00388C4EFB
MAAPPNFEKGQSTYRPPISNGQYYGWWKTRLHDFIMDEDSDLWDVVCDGPFVPMKNNGEGISAVPITRMEYKNADKKAIEKNFRAKKILLCSIGPDKYNRISTCQSAKETGKLSKLSIRKLLNSIINELHSLGEVILRNKLVCKILSVLPVSWESRVNSITKAKDLQKLTIDELIGNLKTYEMKKKKDLERRELKNEKNLVRKANNSDLGCDETNMKCRKPGHLIKECPLHKQDHYKHKAEKVIKRKQVPDRRFKRRDVADNIVKQALAAWGDSPVNLRVRMTKETPP